jgi:quercetin dioxygenase-like cupin family protein
MDNKKYSEMVEKEEFPTEMSVPLDTPTIDERGVIQNILNSHVGSVAIITSKAGSVRSNHWHQSNWHYLYVISGKMKYLERNLDGSGLKEKVYQTGELVFTAPHKAHRTEFLEDTVLLSLGKSSKEHQHHEEDLVRVIW